MPVTVTAERDGRPPRGDGTRWDVQGLRAFAVVAVVLYHLWPGRLTGGFTGVDVFFVVSGFLITGHLVRELERSGRIALAGFWARRAKRLLPAASLTLLATGTAVLVVVPSALWGQYGRELIASAVSLQNWQLAADAVDYLAQGDAPSPFQHFWSLSVEEQFYVGMPLLLLGATLVARRLRRRGARPAVVARVLLGVVLAGSLTWSVVETASTPGVAYFSTATRAWEFALGGLAATVRLPVPRTVPARTVRVVGAWTGVVLLVASVLLITPDMPFPGALAALPVAGAALVVLFGAHSGLQSVGRLGPVAFTGRISYAVYLWHWPAIVLLPFVTGHPLGLRSALAVLVATAVVATLSTLFVEEPLRSSLRVRDLRPRRVALAGGLATLLVVALGAGSLVALRVQEQQAAEAAARLAAGDVACFGAAARIGSSDPCVNPDLATVRVPGPATRADDLNEVACWTNGSTGDTFRACRIGPATGYRARVLAIGDSHNNALIAAFREVAERYHWRIDVAGHAGCYLTTAQQVAPSAKAVAACDAWKEKAFAWVEDNADDADAVFVTHATSAAPVVTSAGQDRQRATVDGLVGAWQRVRAAGLPVIALRDNPLGGQDVVACVGRMTGATTDACDLPRSRALQPDGSAEAAARVDGAHLVDLTDLYCTATTCPAVVGGVVVHRDNSHITATFARTLAPFLGRAIAAALRDR